MGRGAVLRAARDRVRTRGIVDRYLVALEREERLRESGAIDHAALDQATLESAALQPSFIAVAAEFGRRHGISHATWMEALVSAEVLAAAGVASVVDTIV
jgi:hypothetical protein